jgi:hypothetical protein
VGTSPDDEVRAGVDAAVSALEAALLPVLRHEAVPRPSPAPAE